MARSLKKLGVVAGLAVSCALPDGYADCLQACPAVASRRALEDLSLGVPIRRLTALISLAHFVRLFHRIRKVVFKLLNYPSLSPP